jgi:hypothetical protein
MLILALSRTCSSQAIIKGLFEQGLMGIETSADHGGSEMSFMAAIIAIEGELRFFTFTHR